MTGCNRALWRRRRWGERSVERKAGRVPRGWGYETEAVLLLLLLLV